MNKKIIIVTVLAIAIGNGVIWFAWEPSPEGAGTRCAATTRR